MDPTSCLHNACELELRALIWHHNVGQGCDERGRIVKVSDMAEMKITELIDYKI